MISINSGGFAYKHTQTYTEAHTYGSKSGGRQLAIIILFLSWKQRTSLNGSGSGIRIGEYVNKIVRETRHRLYQAMQAAHDNGTAVSLRYEKKYIDHKPYVLGNNDDDAVPLKQNPRVQMDHS